MTTVHAASPGATPWQVKSASYGTRLGLMTLTILLTIVMLVCFLVAFGVGSAVLRGDNLPDSTTTNIIMVAITFGVGLLSLGGLVLIWPYMRGPVSFTPAYGLVDPRGLGVPFEVRFQRYLWGRSMRGKGSVHFAPDGLVIGGNMEPHALFQLGVVLALTILPAIFFNFGLGVIPALLVAYYIGRKQISRTVPYAALSGLTVKGRQLTVRVDGVPKSISFAVAPSDGERLYRELLPRFPAALGGWQGQ
jgi:hypothetical protein